MRSSQPATWFQLAGIRDANANLLIPKPRKLTLTTVRTVVDATIAAIGWHGGVIVRRHAYLERS
jgi:hypothetical protein